MQITFRPAVTEDFDYCKRLYFTGLKTIIEELNLDRVAQAVSFQQQWELTQIRIILLDGLDVGWLQSVKQAHASRCLLPTVLQIDLCKVAAFW